jgi:hypothetical protein
MSFDHFSFFHDTKGVATCHCHPDVYPFGTGLP